MFASKLIANRTLLILGTLLLLLGSVAAQPQNDPERQKAIDMYESQNMVAALPLLEKASLAYPNDPAILSRLGFTIYAVSVDEKDAAKRKNMRDRALSILRRSQKLGDNSNLTQMTVAALEGPDATQLPFTNIRAAEAAIREGETAFMRGDMDKAIAAYERALKADPNLYDAALYAGDAEFKKAMNSTDPQFRSDHFNAAGIWFAKAIAIDANRETAYRYWGDALDAAGKINDARDKFVEAIIAEPYSQRSYVGLTQWAEKHQISLGHPKIEIPSSVSSTKPGEVNIAIDPSTLKGGDDGSGAWITYGLVHAAWASKKDGSRSEKFARAYPGETAYRHSLAEEHEALQTVAQSVQTDMKANKIKQLTIALDNLMRLQTAGLLEPYILFAHPDQGIARDYGAYRTANRAKLRRYWLEIAIIK
jgi:tetratricopeptide (TPR) repeat protein